MSNQSMSCMNVDSDPHSNSSSPVPVIGLYVTGATLVCLLFIVIDIFLGFCSRKKWLPCHLFTLNSATLAVLAVATKLPVDLTTSMPSAVDQLSKLTGTTFICICMAFLMPSSSLTSFSESVSNMISLTIFVITVLVNVCIQMRTGVITSFKANHIVVLCCMIVLLTELWISIADANDTKDSSSRSIKAYIKKTDERSLLERLKVCYLFSFQKNPQFYVSRRFRCVTSCIVSIVCAAILLREIFRSFVSKELKFPQGHSDYKWSMQGIVVSQTITVVVGCFGTTFRFLSMAKHILTTDAFSTNALASLCPRCGFVADTFPLILYPLEIILQLLSIISLLLSILLFCSCAAPYLLRDALNLLCTKATESVEGELFNFCDEPKDGFEVEDMIKEFNAMTSREEWELDEWALKKGEKQMMRMIEFVNKSKFPIHLIQLLRKTPQSPVSLTTLLQNRRVPGSEEYRICPVSILVLAKITTLSIPPSMSQCIYDSFKEFLQAIQYIGKKEDFNYSQYYNRNNFKFLWGNLYFDFLGEIPKPGEDSQSQTQLDKALKIIREVKLKSENARHSSVKKELAVISEFIENKAYVSVEDLYRDLEQLFVNMIRELLVQLAAAVLKEIVESSKEDLEGKVREALILVSKFEQLRDLDPLSFLVGTTTRTNSATNANVAGEDRATLENNGNLSAATDASTEGIPGTQKEYSTGHSLEIFAEEDCESRRVVSDATQDEIIQIE